VTGEAPVVETTKTEVGAVFGQIPNAQPRQQADIAILRVLRVRRRPLWLTDHNLPAKPVMTALRVIVIVTRARGRQWVGGTALPGLYRAHDVDFRAVGVIGIDPSLYLVNDEITIEERHLPARGDGRCVRHHAERRDCHRRGIGRRSRGCRR
jgi:hypothetical protein